MQVLASAGAGHKESKTVDQTRFEGLAKEIAGSRSRRQVLRGLAAGVGGGAFALLTARSSEAASCRHGVYLSCCETEDCSIKEAAASCRGDADRVCGRVAR